MASSTRVRGPYLNDEARMAIWPTFDVRWIHEEKDGFVVFSKPVGLATVATRPELGDGLLERAQRYFENRDGHARKLFPVHRLDAETSGLLIAATNPTRARELSAAFSTGSIDKKYVAVVRENDPTRLDGRILEHRLVYRDGKSLVVPTGGKLARSTVDVVKTKQDKALLSLRLETGRTHQLRVQLAHEGAPIAGDVIYSNVMAPRLMLHASLLRIDKLGTFASKLPSDLSAWFDGETNASLPPKFGTTIEAALRRRWHLRDGSKTTAFRCIHGHGDGLPGLDFDLYGEWGLIHIRSEECARRESEILTELSKLPLRGLYIIRRPRQASRMSSGEIADRAPSEPIGGEAAPKRFAAWEGDVCYRVSLGAGMSTGLFLDQRRNRNWIRNVAAGKRVLNLFSYTCGFSAAALQGNAREVISIDASKSALKWGEENLNGYDRSRWRNYSDDVFVYLRRAERRGEQFDIIVVDPPTYATTKSSRFRSGKDWCKLVALVAPLLRSGGILLCCSNDERMTQRAFRKHVRTGLASISNQITMKLRDRSTYRDVCGQSGAEAQLKTIEVAFLSAGSGHHRHGERGRKSR